MQYPNSSRTTAHAAKFVDGADVVLHNGDIAYATGYLALWERFMSQIAPLAGRLPYMTTQVGLGRIVALYCHSFTLHQIRYHVRYPSF